MKCRKVLKKIAIIASLGISVFSCGRVAPAGYRIADDNGYEASLFRQHCAVCHGPEGEGKTLADGTRVPSLRQGDFKFRTTSEIARQISEGGHGMTPFRSQLSEREINLMAEYVHDKLRADAGQQPH